MTGKVWLVTTIFVIVVSILPVSIESESIYDLLEIHYRSFHIQMAQDSKVLWSFRFLPNWTQFHFTSATPLSSPLPLLHSIYIMFVSPPLSVLSVFCILVAFWSSPKKPQKVNKTPLELLFCSRVTSLSLKYRSSTDGAARSWFVQFIPLREHKIRDTFAVNGQ